MIMCLERFWNLKAAENKKNISYEVTDIKEFGENIYNN